MFGIEVARKITDSAVIEALAYWFLNRGIPSYAHSDNGAEFVEELIRE